MEQKIAPTSPKQNPARQQKAVIEQKKKEYQLLVFILLLIVSVLAGGITSFYLITKTNIVSWYSPSDIYSQILARDGAAEYQKSEQQRLNFANTVEKPIVRIYAFSIPESPKTAEEALIPQVAFRGFGTLLTNDGVSISSVSVFNDDVSYTGQTYDGRTFPIKDIYKDPVSQLAFFTLTGSAFPVADITDKISSVPLTSVYVANRVNRDSLELAEDSLDKQDTNSFAVSLFQSSESFFSDVRLRSGFSFAQGSPIYAGDHTLIGLVGDTATGTVLFLPERDVVVSQYLTTRTVSYARLGIIGVNLSDVPYLPLPVTQNVHDGFLLVNPNDENESAVVKYSPAYRSGLATGDIITKIGNSIIGSQSEIPQIILKSAVGSTLEISYLRGGNIQTTTATLDALNVSKE